MGIGLPAICVEPIVDVKGWDMDYSEAFSRVEQEEEYIVNVLKKIIAVDTSVPPGENYAKLLDVV